MKKLGKCVEMKTISWEMLSSKSRKSSSYQLTFVFISLSAKVHPHLSSLREVEAEHRDIYLHKQTGTADQTMILHSSSSVLKLDSPWLITQVNVHQ